MSGPREASLQPLFLKLEGRTVLVVGAGLIAERKVSALLDAHARVRLVAPRATTELQRLAREGALEWRERAFDEGDLDGAWLVVTATDDPETQRRVGSLADEHHLFVLAVDDPENASAYSGAVVRRPPFVIAISSSGAAPALSRLVREIVEEALPGDDWIAKATELRARWKTLGTPMGDRFGELVRDFKARAR